MAAGKEIRSKIKSVENTKKITKAMEMVAASKMRKAQDRMRASRPYSERVRNVALHISEANPAYRHAYLRASPERLSKVGVILVTSDKGLCGGLNANILRLVMSRFKGWNSESVVVKVVAIGSKGVGFVSRLGHKVGLMGNVVHLGDKPNMEKLLGISGLMIDAFTEGEVDEVYIAYTSFVNTMKQEPTFERLLPLGEKHLQKTAGFIPLDYVYEPDPKPVLDTLFRRYIEVLIYQSVAENMASEQSARMVAMKAATDNAGNVISELKLEYNKARQAAITKELSEIVSGAAAV